MCRYDDLIFRQAALDEFKTWKPITASEHLTLDAIIDTLIHLPPAQHQSQWVQIMDGDGEMPPVNKDGESEMVLVSFSNCSGLCISQYRVDEEGGAFYDGDSEDTFAKSGVFVNAWLPLPEPYKERTEGET